MKRALSRKNAWDCLPPLLRTGVGRALRLVPPAYVLGGRFRSTLRFIAEAEWWTAEEARRYQVGELQRVCRLARLAPYYRRMFAAAGFNPDGITSLDDLRRLPTLDRDLVAAHREELCVMSPRSPQVDYVSTSGTSGPPLAFYIGADRSAREYAYLISSWSRVGFRLGMPLVMFGGREVPEDADGLRHQHDPVLNRHYYSNFHMGDREIARYIAHIRTLGPCFLHAYPSAATMLALFARRTGIELPATIRGVILESESILGPQRDLIADTFGCPTFSCYGQSEKVALAAECDGSSLCHVFPTYGYAELLDSRGAPVTDIGQRGEIVATGFMNRVMPFIRYRTGDYATLAGYRCGHCGRNHLLLRDLRGFRAREYLVARDGSLVSWTALNLHDDTLARVRAFRFRQNEPGRAVLYVAPADGFDDTHARRIEQRFRQKLDGSVSIRCEVVPDIPPAARGKAMYVDQRIAFAADGCNV